MDIENLYSIQGYQSLFKSKNSRSGGLAFFIRSDIFPKCKVMDSLCFMEDFIESFCVEVKLTRNL